MPTTASSKTARSPSLPPEESEPLPFEFIKLPNTHHHDAQHDLQRLEHHLRSSEMIEKFDGAIRALSDKVKDRWLTRRLPYLQVSVLLIRWEEDDLGVDEEIEELRDLLARFFRYSVESWLIPKGSPKMAYIALVNKLHAFTETCNDQDSLHWIYYGGHGKQDPRYPGPIWFP